MDSVGEGITFVKKPQNSTSPSSSKSRSKLRTYKLPEGSHESQRHGKKGSLNCDVRSTSGNNRISGFESSYSVKHAVNDSETCDSSSFVGVTELGLQVNCQSGPHSGVTYCSSPQNSYYSATEFSEVEECFTVTEASEFYHDKGEVSRSCEFIESTKVNSSYRQSCGSDISEESSSSTSSSAMYKPHKGNDVRWIAIGKARSHYGELQLNHFRLLKQLGSGDIGKVYLAELVGTRTYFAMKVMNKADLESRKKLPRARTEREILQSLDHPFLPTLYTHFETKNHSCLVMELCPGGDLHSLRQRRPHKCFPEHAARFYVAEVLLALEYLHMLGVIYRDLKPENVLVREDGHIMLSDFDLSLRCSVNPTLVTAFIEPSCMMQPACFAPLFLAKKAKKAKKSKAKPKLYAQGPPLLELLAEPTNARSMSFVGTHEYLAPEIIKGEGHGSAVDWWTFGIFLYELLFGKTPFKGQGNRATLFNVVGQPLKFPESPSVSFAARDLIRGLLVKEPQHRLAYRRGATEIKQHPFFQSINWALVRCATPPEAPRPFMLTSGEEVPGLDVNGSGDFHQIDFF